MEFKPYSDADVVSRDAAVKIAEHYGLANGSVLGHHSGVADAIASEIAKLPTPTLATQKPRLIMRKSIDNIIQQLSCCKEDRCKRCSRTDVDIGACIDFQSKVVHIPLALIEDVILELEKETPRLVTEQDFDDPELTDGYGFLNAWCEQRDNGDLYTETIPKSAITDSDAKILYRHWTRRPSDEQRKELKWNDRT